MFPHGTAPATIPEVDAFMAGIGVTLTHRVTRDDLGAQPVHLQNYYLAHANLDLRYPDVRGAGIHFANYWELTPEATRALKPRKQQWFVSLNRLLYSRRDITAARLDADREFRVLDHVATAITDLGAPRAWTALTAYLYGIHGEARRGSGNPYNRDPDALAHYMRLAHDTSLSLTGVYRHDAAHRGLPLPELFTYLEAGVPYLLARELLGVKDTEYWFARS